MIHLVKLRSNMNRFFYKFLVDLRNFLGQDLYINEKSNGTVFAESIACYLLKSSLHVIHDIGKTILESYNN